MKILIISHEYPPIGGGGANACMNLSRQYAYEGHDVEIVTVWYEGLEENEIIPTEKGSVHITRVKAKRANKEHCSFSEMLSFIMKAKGEVNARVKKAISDNDPFDICQIFFGIPSGTLGYYLKLKYKLPYVIRFGGGDIPGFQERFTKVYKLIGPAIRLIWKRAYALVANSQGLKELAEEFCDKYPILVFPNGVDTDYWHPKEREHKDNSINLLFISRLIERKGLQFVIPGLRKLQDESGKKVHLTIVGDGPYREKLEQLVEENQVSEMVSFLGQKDKDELAPIYQDGDVFIFPSKKEGMPNAVLEAMACGLPIVMSPCQGSEELIDGNGIITDSDLSRFNEYILKILNMEDDELKAMSNCSLKRAKEMFSWESVAGNYLQLFESISK